MMRLACVLCAATAVAAARETPTIRFGRSSGTGLYHSLQTEMGVIAQEISGVLREKRITAVRVGDFAGPVVLESTGGALVAHALSDELTRAGVRVDPASVVVARGDYEDVFDQQSGLLAIRLTVRLIDRTGRALYSSDRAAFGEALFTRVLGLTVALPPTASRKETQQALEAAMERPRCHVAGAAVSVSPTSPYKVELRTAARPGGDYEGRVPKVVDGLAFADIGGRDVFAVRAVNQSDSDAVIAVTIDGLSVFAFSDVKDAKAGGPRYQHVVVPKRGAVTLTGWHRPNRSFDVFRTRTYASSLPPLLKTGTVTVTFAKSWPETEPAPADDPRNSARCADSEYPRLIEDPPRTPRQVFGVVREVVSIRFKR